MSPVAKDVFGLKQQRTIWIILILLSLAVYLNSIYGEFVLDDEILIQKYPVIRSFSMDLITYRLVRTFSYAVDYFFWGLNPLGYHLSNLFYNTVTVLIVFFLTQRLTGIFFVSLLTAFLFAVHPIHTEAVSYLSGRRDILSAMFYLLGFLLYLRGRQEKQRWMYVPVLLCYLAGILSKEMAVTLPLMIFAYEVIVWVEKQKDETGHSGLLLLSQAVINTMKKFKWAFLSVFLFLCFYLYVILFVQGASGLVRSERFLWWGGSPTANFTTVCRVLSAYIYKLFFPVILQVDYHLFPYSRSLLDPRFWAAFSMLVILFWLSLKFLRRGRLFSFAIWWFFIALLPVMQIIPHHILMAEHYLYLPSYGFCLALSLGLYKLFQKKNLKIPIVFLTATLVILFSIRTADRNQDWRDIVTLTREGLKHHPENPLYHFFLGRTYALNKLFPAANRELGMSTGSRHDYADVHAVKALVLFQQGEYEEGVRETEEALRREPGNQMALNNMGYYAAEMGDDQTALEHYAQVEPDYESVSVLLKTAYLHVKSGELEKAEKSLLKLKHIQPENTAASFGLADVYTRELRFDEAIRQYTQFLSGNSVMAHNKHAEEAGDNVDRVEASLLYVRELKEKYGLAMDALAKGDLSKGHQWLGELYMVLEDYETAQKEFKEAMRSTEETTLLELLLGEVYVKSGNFQEAEKIYGWLAESGPDQSLEVFVGAGEFYAKTLRFSKAKDLFRRALERNPDDVRISEYLNWSIKLQRSLEDSEALQRSGRPIEASLIKSDIYIALGQEEEAIKILEDALEVDSIHQGLLNSLASLYETMDYPYWSKTIRTYRKLLSLDENNPDVLRRLGEYYYTVVKDYESALDSFQKSLALNPHQEKVEQIKSTIDKLKQYVRLYLG